ncbi:unnamed protein product [Eruca vesicaria subsp. sativa]|uniref:Uncharacterized protein n=1 Tax=Eruca vesicaria subsp. sativa TaxID=29727 RepID=A0ABC8KAA9_ERUVS|nr:unnamed protein product [Eruca vesicaria subsp. sativa]
MEIIASLYLTRPSSLLSSCPNTSNTATSLASSASSTSTKVDTDRYEFANDWFVRGEKELLKNVIRRKNVQSREHQSKATAAPTQGKSEKSELWKEVDILKGDKKVLALMLMFHLEDRVEGMEESQQEMLSFLVMVMQNPSLLVQLLQPKENSWRKTEGGGGGAKILEEVTDDGETNTNDLPLVM